MSELKNWTTTLLIPLLFKDKTLISKNTYRFVNSFLSDFNRPYLTKKLLLVYQSPMGMTVLDSLEAKIKAHPLFFSHYNVRINGEFYYVYAFDIDACLEYRKDIYNLLSYNMNEVLYTTKLKILKFWGFPMDSNEHSFLFNPISPTLTNVKFDKEEIPEEDANELESFLDAKNYGLDS